MGKFVRFDVCCVVFFTCETSKAFLVDVDAPWVHRGYQNVDTDVKFEAIDKQWIMNIPTYNTRLVNWHLRNIVDDKYSFTLGAICWFNDPLVMI